MAPLTKLLISVFPVLVPIAFSCAKIWLTRVMTLSYSVMITVRSLQDIEDDLRTLLPFKEPSDPESPVRRSFNFCNSSFRAGLESTSSIKASMSAICLFVSSWRLRTATTAVVDVDRPGPVVETEFLVVDAILGDVTVVSLTVDGAEELALPPIVIPIVLLVMLPVVVLLKVELSRLVLMVTVLPADELPLDDELTLPLVAGALPIEDLADVVMSPAFVLSNTVLPSAVLLSVVL